MSYEPGVHPTVSGEDSKQLLHFVMREFREIASQFSQVEDVRLKELHVEPTKPRNGMIILADGINFNPGKGGGFYGRSDGAWVFLNFAPYTFSPGAEQLEISLFVPTVVVA